LRCTLNWGAVVTITDSTLTGLNAVNAGAANAEVTIADSTINCNDNRVGEKFGAISLNQDAAGTQVVVIGSQFYIKDDSIVAVNGASGKGATITIDEVDGVGKVQVSGSSKAIIDAAMSKIKAIVAVPEIGEVYEGTVRSVMPYGCFVEFMPGKDGLLHISEIDWKRLETVEEAGIKEGDKLQVKLLEIDPKTGKFKLSRRVLIEKPEGYVERERRPRPERSERPVRGERGERPMRGDRRPRPTGDAAPESAE
jgi:ribosomal protein S1